MLHLEATPIVDGFCRAPLLAVREPLSFWGGVDIRTGRISDTRSDAFGEQITDRVLWLWGTRGSSSSSSVLLELIHTHRAPAGICLVTDGGADAILSLGAVVADEMGWVTMPLFAIEASRLEGLGDDQLFASDCLATMRLGGAVDISLVNPEETRI
jgi:predicted aconitase with swiveling domain